MLHHEVNTKHCSTEHVVRMNMFRVMATVDTCTSLMHEAAWRSGFRPANFISTAASWGICQVVTTDVTQTF